MTSSYASGLLLLDCTLSRLDDLDLSGDLESMDDWLLWGEGDVLLDDDWRFLVRSSSDGDLCFLTPLLGDGDCLGMFSGSGDLARCNAGDGLRVSGLVNK